MYYTYVYLFLMIMIIIIHNNNTWHFSNKSFITCVCRRLRHRRDPRLWLRLKLSIAKQSSAMESLANWLVYSVHWIMTVRYRDCLSLERESDDSTQSDTDEWNAQCAVVIVSSGFLFLSFQMQFNAYHGVRAPARFHIHKHTDTQTHTGCNLITPVQWDIAIIWWLVRSNVVANSPVWFVFLQLVRQLSRFFFPFRFVCEAKPTDIDINC